MIAKARADELVCQQGLADSREQARRLIAMNVNSLTSNRAYALGCELAE